MDQDAVMFRIRNRQMVVLVRDEWKEFLTEMSCGPSNGDDDDDDGTNCCHSSPNSYISIGSLISSS